MNFRSIRDRVSQYKWPFDTSLTIAMLALVISTVQLIVTAPLFSALFVSPAVVVKEAVSYPKADFLAGSYIIENMGNAPATKVEIGIVIEMNQRLWFLPNLVTNLVEGKNSVLVKPIRVEIERLLPREQITMLVVPGKKGKKVRTDSADNLIEAETSNLPVISYVRSAEGVGKIKKESHKKDLTLPSNVPPLPLPGQNWGWILPKSP